MSILDDAKKLAEKKRQSEQREADEAKAVQDVLERVCKQFRKVVLAKLKELDGQASAHGKFRLERRSGGPGENYVFAYLTVERNRRVGEKVAWFKAEAVSGTWAPSDDYRGEPFTEARLTARFYPPQFIRPEDHDGYWDTGERRYYHNGGWTISVTSGDKLPKFFEDMTEQLAKWM